MYSCKKLILKKDQNLSYTKKKAKSKTKKENNNKLNNIRIIKNKKNDHVFGRNYHNFSPDIYKTLNFRFTQIIDRIKKSKIIKDIKKQNKGEKTLTPIPKPKYKRKKANKNDLKLFKEAVHTAIAIRRNEYNEYLYKRREREVKSAEIKRLYRKYPFKKVVRIQTNFKGFSVRQIRKDIEHLKFHECSIEVFLLMVLNNINRYYIRKTFNILKKVKKRKFNKKDKNKNKNSSNIDDELDFNDKIKLKLPKTYYNNIKHNHLNHSLNKRNDIKNKNSNG
jgi:hypothetical protein